MQCPIADDADVHAPRILFPPTFYILEEAYKQTKKKVYILRRLTAVYLAFCFVVIDNVMLL